MIDAGRLGGERPQQRELLVRAEGCGCLRLLGILPANQPVLSLAPRLDLRLSATLVLPLRCPVPRPARMYSALAERPVSS